ncbi:hypothetical protein KV205_25535 [Streptomyces sp. SKN60]|uniref:hypothetical protein n=1 Tax=Streptomyces sp. SKN60 TaxID=2855506 RepID=UPI002246B125|nr:hypothetical protein [Streptomyces sp. SKN60]MCX2183868.1 hypothetical protein [Streptomyces sp. SKN60]
MSRITDLWRAGLAPARSGLYRADGSAREAATDGAALSWFELGAPLDLDALLAEDPEGVTQIDIHRRCFAKLPDASGYVCGGDGAHGSEGFAARLDTDRNLVWVVFMADSNPFERVATRGTTAVFFNNLGNSLAIDLTHHDFRA